MKSFKQKLALLFILLVTATAWTQQKPADQKPQYQPPRLTDPNAWTMVVVPDTQMYSYFRWNHGILTMMTSWIYENRNTLKIQNVLHVGDIVEKNAVDSYKDPRPVNSEGMWKAVSHSFGVLDGAVPYILVQGNHDLGIHSAENRNSRFNDFFPVERNPSINHLVECGENSFGKKTLENSAYEFKTPNGWNLLIIALTFAPTDKNLEWAKEVAQRPQYKDHFGILLTHSYMTSHSGKNARIKGEGYTLNKQGGNAGQAIWEKLVFPVDNIRLVICGHISAADNWRGCVGFAKDKNHAGKVVSQMLFDTQALGGGWGGNGGDGWLRLLEFQPDKKTIKARTFSPFFANSPSTRHLAWNTDPINQFEFNIDEP